LLIAVCGAFFVIGFMEGKRQNVRVVVQPAAETPLSSAITPEVKGAGTPQESSSVNQDRSVRDQLDWYKNVQSGQPQTPVPAGNPAATESAKPAAAKTVDSAPPKSKGGAPAQAQPAAARPGKITYSLQAGAFLQRREAELKASELKAKNFACEVEDPKQADRFFRVRVGSFGTRAEAVAMQRKLAKAGFDCIIKSK
jgi:cell division protein FtsN